MFCTCRNVARAAGEFLKERLILAADEEIKTRSKSKRGRCLIVAVIVFITRQIYCAPVAQLVEYWAVMWEVVSLTPAEPSVRVLKQLSRKCCLCNYMSKWLVFKVFTDKDYI